MRHRENYQNENTAMIRRTHLVTNYVIKNMRLKILPSWQFSNQERQNVNEISGETLFYFHAKQKWKKRKSKEFG